MTYGRKKKKFKYTPLSLKEIIKEMKSSIDLMIDLAYSAIKFGSKEIADEVTKMEGRIHELTFLLNVQIVQTHVGGFEEAKTLEPIVVMGYSIDKISDALADIARVVYINSDIQEFTQLFWHDVPEPIIKLTIKHDCQLIGQNRRDIHFRSNYGVDVIAIKRDDKWSFDKEDILRENDILIVKGELDPIRQLKKLAHDDDPISFKLKDENVESVYDLTDPDLLEYLQELKKDYIYITDISETMVELSLASIFLNNYEVAEDVLEMEELMDGLNISFEKGLLDFAHDFDSPRDLTGIMRIVFSCEQIADAAAHIAENILKGFEPHPILQKAIEETQEVIVRETLSPESFFKGKTYEQLQDKRYKRGFHIIAAKRNNTWIYSFKAEFIFQVGDLIIGLGPTETVSQWRKCVNPKFSEEED